MTVVNKLKKLDYTPLDLGLLSSKKITQNEVDESFSDLIKILEKSEITASQILKNIKQTSFNKKLHSYYQNKFPMEEIIIDKPIGEIE